MDIGNFTKIASNSWLSGHRRVITDPSNSSVNAKGLWQQIKLSFMSKEQRIQTNHRTIDAFCESLKEHYGDEVYGKVMDNDRTLTSKKTRGTKLLSRDVKRFLELCNQKQVSLALEKASKLAFSENFQTSDRYDDKTSSQKSGQSDDEASSQISDKSYTDKSYNQAKTLNPNENVAMAETTDPQIANVNVENTEAEPPK